MPFFSFLTSDKILLLHIRFWQSLNLGFNARVKQTIKYALACGRKFPF